jgi:NAD+ synthase
MPNAFNGSELPDWAVPPEAAAEKVTQFISNFVGAAGGTGVVVGMSGGIDSSVAAALAVRGLGPDRVLGVFLPYATSAPSSLNDARAVSAHLGIRTELVEISPMVDAWLHAQTNTDHIRQGNVMARVRMIILFDISARDSLLVLGTGNRSESLLGYTTLHGDNACALNPLGQLYKTEIRLLAEYLALPEAVILKPPSADLWVGQSDEEELGFTYAQADQILHHLVDERLGEKQLASLGLSPQLVGRVKERMHAMAFKRRLPPAAVFPNRPDPDGAVKQQGRT